MKLVDITTRNAKELESLKKKVAAFVKKAGCNTGEVTWGSNGPMAHWVQVENDGSLGDHLRDIISKSQFTKQVQVEEHKGEYMWSANLYIRPVSIVSFVF